MLAVVVKQVFECEENFLLSISDELTEFATMGSHDSVWGRGMARGDVQRVQPLRPEKTFEPVRARRVSPSNDHDERDASLLPTILRCLHESASRTARVGGDRCIL